MINAILKDKPTKLFLGITAFFVANALIAECIGGKIFSLEGVLGIPPANFTILGEKGLSFNLTCGVLLWPLEFVITDIVNEYYGPKAVKRISIGSLGAFLISQFIDVIVFHKIKKVTGEKMPWLRATGSTLVSQLVDSFVVLVIAFKLGNNWTWSFVIAVCLVNYMYKFAMAIILTPAITFIEARIENYVGHETAKKMKLAAMGLDNEI